MENVQTPRNSQMKLNSVEEQAFGRIAMGVLLNGEEKTKFDAKTC